MTSQDYRLSAPLKLDTIDFLHSTVNDEWGMPGLACAEVNDHLICLLNVQDQIVDSASVHQSLQLLLIGQVLVFPNETHPCCVICILDDMIRSRCSTAVKDLGHIPEEGS